MLNSYLRSYNCQYGRSKEAVIRQSLRAIFITGKVITLSDLRIQDKERD